VIDGDRDNQVLNVFVGVFCRAHHGGENGLCPDCADLLAYAQERRRLCPLEPKPKCKDCPVHCYEPEYRRRIREIMRFSGMHFVKRGRLDWLIRYFL